MSSFNGVLRFRPGTPLLFTFFGPETLQFFTLHEYIKEVVDPYSYGQHITGTPYSRQLKL
jgi:hypothetical protein